MLRRIQPLAWALLAALAAGGCVERQMTLVTDPPGALAYYNGKEVGTTPTTFHFTYHQPPDVRFELDGYNTLRVVPEVKAPLYQRFPLDFFAEVLWPFTIYDRHTFEYALEVTTDPTKDELLQRAGRLREAAAP